MKKVFLVFLLLSYFRIEASAVQHFISHASVVHAKSGLSCKYLVLREIKK